MENSRHRNPPCNQGREGGCGPHICTGGEKWDTAGRVRRNFCLAGRILLDRGLRGEGFRRVGYGRVQRLMREGDGVGVKDEVAVHAGGEEEEEEEEEGGRGG